MADNGITNSTFITDDRIVDAVANNLPPYKISNWIEVCHRLGLADDAIEVEKRNHINGTLAFTGLVRWMLKTWYCCYPNEANITNLISIMKTLHFGLAAGGAFLYKLCVSKNVDRVSFQRSLKNSLTLLSRNSAKGPVHRDWIP